MGDDELAEPVHDVRRTGIVSGYIHLDHWHVL
jgi:hypothetical protein